MTSPDFPDPKDPRKPHKDAGKAPIFKGWTNAGTADEAIIRGWTKGVRGHGNTGLVCGDLVGVDIDVPVPELAAKLETLADALLGATPLVRIGQAPKSLRCYQVAEPFTKLMTDPLFLPDGTKMQVEVLAGGQQFVAFGIHPGTRKPYEWPEARPDAVPFADVPETCEGALQGFVAAAEGVLREAGGRTKQEIEDAAKPAPEPAPDPKDPPKPAKGKQSGEFFKAVNAAALGSIGRWLPTIFPKAEERRGGLTDGVWRVTSAELDRSEEEDLSVHPVNGIRDFGTDRKYSPIDVAIRWGGAADAKAAAMWLCEKLGRAPADLGWKEPKERPARQDDAGPTDPASDDESGITEDGVALIFAGRFKGQLLYCHTAGTWYQWNGWVWAREETKLAFSWSRQVARGIARKLDSKKVQAVLGRAAFAAAVERFAQADRAFAVTSAAFDTNPWLLGTPGGTVELQQERKGKLRPASREDRITKATAVAPAPTAACPTWLRFLDQATAADKDLIRFLRQWCGYCLTGDTREHALLFIYGPGGNGKSVFLNTVYGILGSYARIAAMETFTASQGDRHPTDLAMLRGARLVTASETEEGRAWAEVRIKQLTGGDTITARFMRQDFFEFRPEFKLTIIGNHKPVLRNVDDAARRRFNVVPFVQKPAKPDRCLEAALREEWPGILRWMIEGCLDWQAHGLLRPAVVTKATAEYFSDQDTLGQWLEDCCEQGRGWEDTTASLFGSWRNYAALRGEDAGSAKRFTTWLQRQGCEPMRDPAGTRNQRGFKGVRVKVTPAGEPGE